MNNAQDMQSFVITKNVFPSGVQTLSDGEIHFLYQASGKTKLIYNNNTTFYLQAGHVMALTFPAVFEIIPDKNTNLYHLFLSEKFCNDNQIIPSDYNYNKQISDPHITALFKDLVNEYNPEDTLSKHYSYHIAVLILAHITRNHTTKDSSFILNHSNPQSVERVKKTLKYIANNLERSFSTNELASLTHISKDYFIHEFKKVTGFTVKQIINIIRVRRAKELLTTSKLSISQISEACGFNHYSYFYTIFKKETGLSPIEYRHENQYK